MNFSKKVLPGGLRLVTIPMKDNPTATILVLVEAGSKYETKNISGVSHFLEHMCFKGTAKRPRAIDIALELDRIGAQYNAFTSPEFTGYFAKAHAKHTDKIIDVVSDIYLNPVLPPAEIEKEKGVIIEEINMYNDLPQKKVQDVFMTALYGDQPAGRDVSGTKETVATLKRQNLVDYRKKFYVAPATLVVAAGSFDENKIAAEVEEKFSMAGGGEKGNKPAVVERQDEPKILAECRPTDQTHFILGVRTFNIYREDNLPLRVLTGVLGGGMSSRLFQKMREELGICYYVSASAEAFTDHGFLSVAAGVKNDRLTEAIGAVLEEFRSLKDRLIPEEELRKVKDYLVGSMFLGLESSESLADFFGFQEILGRPIKTAQQIAEEINDISAAEIKDLAEEIFQNKKLNLALIGPREDMEELQRTLNI